MGGEAITIELRLSVGAAGASVEVSTLSVLAQLESSTLGRPVDETAIRSLRLMNMGSGRK
jgi:hypothetical protein